MPLPRVPPIPKDMELRAHFKAIREQAIQTARTVRVREGWLSIKQKHIARTAHREEMQKTLRVILGDAKIDDVVKRSRLSWPTVWRVLMGRMEPGLRVYLRVTRAILLVNVHMKRKTIDRYLLRVLRKPLA